MHALSDYFSPLSPPSFNCTSTSTGGKGEGDRGEGGFLGFFERRVYDIRGGGGEL